MTSLEKLCRANRWRIRPADAAHPSVIASTDADGWNGHFMMPLEGEMWYIVLSDKMGWKRLSIANAQKRQLPSPQVMCHVKELFYGDDEWAVQFYPPKDQHIESGYPYRLDLWMPLNDHMPTPVVLQLEHTDGRD
jgi:hypothetical protein